VGFGWLTRLGSPFLKIFWADISKNLNFFRSDPETALVRGNLFPIPPADKAATTTVGERRESLHRARRSGLIVGHTA
jgi:hypothetical protein